MAPIEQAFVGHPVGETIGPVDDRDPVRLVEIEGVSGAGVHVQLGIAAAGAQLLVELDGWLRAAVIEGSGGDERRRRMSDVVRWNALRAREDEYLEVGSCA